MSDNKIPFSKIDGAICEFNALYAKFRLLCDICFNHSFRVDDDLEISLYFVSLCELFSSLENDFKFIYTEFDSLLKSCCDCSTGDVENAKE